MNKLMMLALTMILTLGLAACNNNDSPEESDNTEESTTQQTPEPVEITDEERVDEETIVANVNGKELKGDKYNPIYIQVKTMRYHNGQDVSDLELLKEQAVNILIEQELIKQEAEELGIEVTEEEVQTELDNYKEQIGDEQYTVMLDLYQVTEEEFKEQLFDDLFTVKYMESEIETEVTDEEIQELYDALKEQDEEIGELAEVEDQIRTTLMNQKQGQQLQAKVDELREESEVETLI